MTVVPPVARDARRILKEKESRMKNLFVGNLSFQTTEDELRSLFESFGEVTRAEIVKDRDSGRSRGFGFVEMAEEESAEKAVAALNGKEVQGRAVTVNEARPRPERNRFGSGSRGGFGGNRFGWSARQRREPRW